MVSKEVKKEVKQELKDEIKIVARKPFVLVSMDPAKDREREMAVFTNAKKLSEYIFTITENAPKKYRWSIITRLQDASIAVVELLYRANFEKGEKRLEYQKEAGVQMRIIDHYAEVAFKLQAISLKKMEYIAKLIIEARKLLAGWSKSSKEKAESATKKKEEKE